MIAPKAKIGMATFDRSIIRRNWSNTVSTPITRAGNLTKTIARRSIRRGGKPSPPGQPPKSQEKGSTPPFKMIFSVPNSTGTSTVVGMVGFGKSTDPAPGLQEKGGSVVRRVPIRGDRLRDRRGKFLKVKTRFERRRVNLAPRPFMAPALEKAKPMIPQLFRGAYNRNARRF